VSDSNYAKDKAQLKIPYLEVKNVTKVFPGVIAVDNVTLRIYSGEVHAIIGEMGPGRVLFVIWLQVFTNQLKGKYTVLVRR